MVDLRMSRKEVNPALIVVIHHWNLLYFSLFLKSFEIFH